MAADKPNADPSIETLRGLGAKLRVTKGGQILSVDFRTTPNPVADAEVALIKGRSKLKELFLDGAQISDAAVDDLLTLSSLITLDLQNTALTDAGLAKLGEMKQLRLLLLNGTQVSSDLVAELRKRMLNTRIVFR